MGEPDDFLDDEGWEIMSPDRPDDLRLAIPMKITTKALTDGHVAIRLDLVTGPQHHERVLAGTDKVQKVQFLLPLGLLDKFIEQLITRRGSN